jgi:serine/threonine protein kinase
VNSRDPYWTAHHGLSAGTRLNGIYEIDRMIGTGGMGEVYQGHEVQTGTTVAIKMLLPEMAENEAALELFRREAAALHYLMHDAIVRYFVFTVEPILQRPYLAMEFVDGRSLSDILEDAPLTLDALLRLMRRVASGLNAAHERGIIHRDVSPDNIIVSHDDVARAKIIDFGIARSTKLGDATIIGSGFAGKHNYVSPEQIGLFGGDVTAKSDVYSFGLVLFYTLTGQKLDMGGTQFQLVEKRRQVPDLGAADGRIRPLLEKMLQPDPNNRPTMAEIESWSADWTAAPLSKLPENSKASSGAPSSKATRPSVRYGIISAFALLLVGISSVAYYEYLSNVPLATIDHPPVGLNPIPLEPKPATPDLVPKEVAKDMPTTKPPDNSPNRSDIVRRFIDQYDGGDCFLITPVAWSESAAVIEGLGASTAPFDLLDKTFKKSQGFEASIGIRLVAPPQCPAITFLNRLRADTAHSPRIALGSVKLSPGQSLAGTIENFSNRVVELLLVTSDGLVQNLSYLLRPGTDVLSFVIEIPTLENSTGGTSPQLVLAVATPRVLDSLRQPQPAPADQFFLQVDTDAQRANIKLNASARYFVVQK